MIRIRSKKLLSGVSTLAVIAAFGAADPALAGQTITSAGNPNPPVTNAVSDDFIDIQAGAFVLADSGGVSLFNSGTVTSFVSIVGATLVGGISNTGSITGSGIFIDASSIGGAISNTGVIDSSPAGIEINDSIVVGGIHNSGTAAVLSGVTDGVLLTGNTILTGGISNEGTIVGFGTSFADGIALQGAGVVVTGGITNSSTGTIQALVSQTGIGINLSSFTSLVGDINNSGRILTSGTSTSIGINMQTGVLAGSILNNAGARIVATSGTGINFAGGVITGNIDNAGTIAGVNGVMLSGALAGGIINQSTGRITASGTGNGITMVGGTIAQGITNDGVISAAAGGSGIVLVGGTFSGGISNSGTIQSGSTGILIVGTAFSGGITNDGAIVSATGAGVISVGSDLNGDFINGEDGSITAGASGFLFNGTDFNGNVLNDGAIVAADQGINMIAAGTITGDITNNGDITASSGIVLTAALIDGSVTNTGSLVTTGGNALTINGTLTGDVTNDGGEINGLIGIYVNGTVEGALSNSGGISALGGIVVDGQIDGGITNSGDILALVGVDLTGATAAHTITQTGGSISAFTALDMVNGQIDTFSGQGGTVEGDILGDGDSFDLNSTTQFAYASGAATGIDHFDVLASGTYLLGTDTRGVDGAGVQVTADHMRYLNAGDTPRVYLDDNTTITLTNDFDQAYNGATAGTLEYFLTTNTGTHGVISAATANVDGTIAANLDPATFAAAPIATGVTFTYTGVITSGGLTGTFDNVGDVLVTSNPFFTGSVIYNGDNVDLTIERLAFNDVLVAESHNQQAVGTALEAIYTAGGYSPDLQDAIEALFSGGTTAEIQARLIELSGSQHAQVGQAVQSVTNSINGMVRERLDSVLLSQDGVRWAGTPAQRYAQAVAVASDAAAPGLRGSQGMTRGNSPWSLWGRAFENEINVDTDADAPGYDHDSQGGIVGVDYAMSPNTTIGGSVTYATSDLWFDTAPDTADIETWQVNLFGSYGFGRFYTDVQASYAWHDIGTLRSIDLPAPAGSDIATAAYDASSWSVNGELGAIWRLGRVNMQPSLSVAYVDNSADGFTESSTTGYSLIVGGADGQSLATTLALRASGQWMMAKTPVVPDFKIGWRHEYLDDNSTFDAAFFDDPTVVMSIVSSQVKADSLVISSGATFGVTKNFEVFFDINGQYNADASMTNASGGLRVTW